MSKQYQCPVDDCEFTAGSKGSVKAHVTRMVRDGHKGLSGPDFGDEIRPVDVAGGSTTDDDGADLDDTDARSRSSRSGGVVPADHRVPETATDGGTSNSRSDGADCCTDPDLAGSAGDYFRLESGEVVQLESGDRVCLNCDELHE